VLLLVVAVFSFVSVSQVISSEGWPGRPGLHSN